jgi:hypothetical protein
MLRQGFAIKTIKNAGMKTHIRSLVNKQSRRAEPPKTFLKSVCFVVLSLRRILDSAGPLSWSHPPSNVNIVTKHFNKHREKQKKQQAVVVNPPLCEV